jgi:hypothetical protein
MTARNITIGWISPGHVTADFCHSVSDTILKDHGRHKIRHTISVECSPRISEGRSQLVDAFLLTDDEWLLMVDSDMGWIYDDFELLCKTADKDTVPILGGLCFGGGRSIGCFPTIYALVDEEGRPGLKRQVDYPKNSLLKVGGTGAAFLMVHRQVYIAMRNRFGGTPENPHPYPWFEERVLNGTPLGEDIAFCFRAAALEIPVHVHTGVKTRHLKFHYLDEDYYESLKK